MKLFKKSILIMVLVTLGLVIPQLNGATRVVDNSSISGTLQTKWNKALGNALKQGKSFWIAYSMDKLMAENEYFISSARITGRIHTTSFSSTLGGIKGTSLAKLIYGKDIPVIKGTPKSDKEQVREAAKRAIDHIKHKRSKHTYKKVKKEVVLLALFETNSSARTPAPTKIRISNISFPFENKGKPIYWLGKTDEENSLQLLTGIFSTLKGDKAKRRMLSTIGSHSDSKRTIPFLSKVVNSDESDEVRSKAAGELGDQDNPSAVGILLKIAKNDHSLEVRRKAVNALEDLEYPVAVDALIEIAKHANNTYIRRKAINTLGDVGTKKAAKALNDIVFNDPNIEMQRKAVNAFEDLPRNEGVPYLINIAKKHPKPYIRKKALDCLGDIKDPRAFEAIKEIAKGK